MGKMTQTTMLPIENAQKLPKTLKNSENLFHSIVHTGTQNIHAKFSDNRRKAVGGGVVIWNSLTTDIKTDISQLYRKQQRS